MNKIKPKKLCGKHILSGVSMDYTMNDAECVDFILDGKTYRATENPSDGYRSWVEGVEYAPKKIPANIPDTEVLISFDADENHRMMRLVETTNGKEVLVIGTEDISGYYPVCVFRYTPENLPCNTHKRHR
jgi:hypothetical protein